jgi:hypothetical protein
VNGREEEMQFKKLKEIRRLEERQEELDMRRRELDRLHNLDAARAKDETSLVGRTRKFAEAIKHVFPDMPTESAELPAFFDSVENLFKLYEIPTDLRSKLLIPRLSGKAKAIVNKFTIKDLDDYEMIKKHLLAEFRLTPRELRSRFTQARKGLDETYALFTARLESSLTYYLRSRNADKDVKKMFDLLIADKLKDCLPSGALHYVLSLEGDECFAPSKIASNADMYTSNYNEKGVYRGNAVSNIQLSAVSIETRPKAPVPNYTHRLNASSSNNSSPVVTPYETVEKGKKACWGCGSESHMLSQCPNKSKTVNNRTVKAKANACTVRPSRMLTSHNSIVATDDSCEVKQDGGAVITATEVDTGMRSHVTDSPVDAVSQALVTDSGAIVMNTSSDSLSRPLNVSRPSNSERVVDSNNTVNDVEVVHVNGCVTVKDIQLTPLQYIDIFVNDRRLKALVDSGCECPLVDSKALLGDPISTIGNIWIQPIVGPAVPAKLAALDVTQFVTESAPASKEGKPLHLVFAVVDNLVGHEVVLPASVADELLQTSQHCYAQPCTNAASVSRDRMVPVPILSASRQCYQRMIKI